MIKNILYPLKTNTAAMIIFSVIFSLFFVSFAFSANADLEQDLRKIKASNAKEYFENMERFLAGKNMGILKQEGAPEQNALISEDKENQQKYLNVANRQIDQLAICSLSLIEEQKSFVLRAQSYKGSEDADYQKFNDHVAALILPEIEKLKNEDGSDLTVEQVLEKIEPISARIQAEELSKLAADLQKKFKNYQAEEAALAKDGNALSEKINQECLLAQSLRFEVRTSGMDLENLVQKVYKADVLAPNMAKDAGGQIFNFTTQFNRDLKACTKEAKKYCEKEEDLIGCIDELPENAKEYPDSYKISAACSAAIALEIKVIETKPVKETPKEEPSNSVTDAK